MCEWLKLIFKWQFMSCLNSHFTVSLLSAVQKVGRKCVIIICIQYGKCKDSLKIGHHHLRCHFSYLFLSHYPQHPSSET